ncbi:MAG: cold shock domain-containing protein [Planctomycetota bacterium]
MPIQGQVKWFDAKKGFGFILGPEGRDVFVHYTQIQGDGFKSLRDGETVAYELSQGDKGLHAVTVNRVRDQAEAEAAAD